ncbi:MAG TPA: translation initiation factor IF-3 [Candidatus Paceibacterota bacterium]|nr:translation initiation factor IF-3 [Candidatus Paceibacterota bacterium]
MKNSYNVNNQIQANKVDLVLLDGTIEKGIPLTQALKMAEEEGLDVVEVSRNNNGLTVCKLVDYGKLMYEREKQKKKNTNQHQHLKEIRYSFNIDKHDLEVKHNKILKFLDKNYSVRYVLELNGRERQLVDSAILKMMDSLENFRNVAKWKDLKVVHGGRKVTIFTILTKI